MCRVKITDEGPRYLRGKNITGFSVGFTVENRRKSRREAALDCIWHR